MMCDSSVMIINL